MHLHRLGQGASLEGRSPLARNGSTLQSMWCLIFLTPMCLGRPARENIVSEMWKWELHKRTAQGGVGAAKTMLQRQDPPKESAYRREARKKRRGEKEGRNTGQQADAGTVGAPARGRIAARRFCRGGGSSLGSEKITQPPRRRRGQPIVCACNTYHGDACAALSWLPAL